MKTSFTVMFDRGNKTHVVAGVTSIVPNLNGFLFFTEDGKHYQIESCDLVDGGMSAIAFEYDFLDEDFEDFASMGMYVLHDHRKVLERKSHPESKVVHYYNNRSRMGQPVRGRIRTE